MALTYNKGEWAEFIALMLSIQRTGQQLDRLDRNGNAGKTPCLLRVGRMETSQGITWYWRSCNHKDVVWTLAPGRKSPVPVDFSNGLPGIQETGLDAIVSAAFRCIQNGTGRSFPNAVAEAIMNALGITRVKAPSSDKMELFIECDGQGTCWAVSVKCKLGASPSLINACEGTTSISYKVDFKGDVPVGKPKNDVCWKFTKMEPKAIRFPAMRPIVRMSGLFIFAKVFATYCRTRNVGKISKILPLCAKEESTAAKSQGRRAKFTLETLERLTSQILVYHAVEGTSGRNNKVKASAPDGILVITKTGDMLLKMCGNKSVFEGMLMNACSFDIPSMSKSDAYYVYKEGAYPKRFRGMTKGRRGNLHVVHADTVLNHWWPHYKQHDIKDGEILLMKDEPDGTLSLDSKEDHAGNPVPFLPTAKGWIYEVVVGVRGW